MSDWQNIHAAPKRMIRALCPERGEIMVDWFTPASDQPELGLWYEVLDDGELGEVVFPVAWRPYRA